MDHTQRTRNRTSVIAEQNTDIASLTQELKQKGAIKIDNFLKLLTETQAIFENEPNVLKLKSPVVIVGDIHGQFYDLLTIFATVGAASHNTYLFLGDYVDRGKFCIEVLTLLLVLKRSYPQNVFLLRGNHEDRTMTTYFNFKLQCQKKYNNSVYETVLDLFQKLPICALIDNKIFAVHAGISPKITKIQEIDRINRFVELEEGLPINDLLWSDPTDMIADSFIANDMRRCSYYYSPTQSEKFIEKNNLKLIIRGHEVTNTGYKYQKSLSNVPITLTIFSAPNYCDTYKNSAVVAMINSSNIEIKAFRETQHPFVLDNYMDVIELTFPFLSVNITSLLKRILTISHAKNKKKHENQKMEDLETIQNLESLEKCLYSHSFEIKKFLFSHVKRQNEVRGQQEGDELSQEAILNFLALKASDEAQKLPLQFGPKNISFAKVNVNLKHRHEVGPDVQV